MFNTLFGLDFCFKKFCLQTIYFEGVGYLCIYTPTHMSYTTQGTTERCAFLRYRNRTRYKLKQREKLCWYDPESNYSGPQDQYNESDKKGRIIIEKKSMCVCAHTRTRSHTNLAISGCIWGCVNQSRMYNRKQL